jgi:hypothetical protein
MPPSESSARTPRVNILALPSHTAILFGLIAVIALGPALAALLPGSRLWWPPIVLGLTLLPVRDFLASPDLLMAQRRLRACTDEACAPVQDELARLSSPGRPVLLVTTPLAQPLEAFGSFRRRFVAMSERLATLLSRNLGPGQGRDYELYRVMLAHEVAHFLNQDIRLAGLARAFLKMLILVMLVNLWIGLVLTAFVIELGPEIFSRQFWTALSEHFAGMLPMLPPVDLTPVLDAFTAQNPQLIAQLADPARQASNYAAFLLYLVGAQWPFAASGAVLLFVYWPRLMAVRELYADARAAAIVGDSSLIPEAVRLHAARATMGAPLPVPRWKALLTSFLARWRALPIASRGLQLRPDFGPQRALSLVQPLAALGSWQRLAVATGIAVVLLDLTLRSALTAGQISEPGMQLPFLVVFLAFSTWLLPHLAAGKFVSARSLTGQVVRLVALFTVIILVPRVLDGLVALVFLQVSPQALGGMVDLWAYALVGVDGGALPALVGVQVSWADFLSLHVFRPILYSALVLPVVLSGLLWLDGRIKQRMLLWYQPGRNLRRAFLLATATLACAGWLVILPFFNHLVFPEIYIGVSPAEALGAALALTGGVVAAVRFVMVDRVWARRCPSCGSRVDGPYRLAGLCLACQAPLHDWLVAPYGDGGPGR